MSNLDAARFQMAYSLFFHMMFAALGVGMPLLMVIAEGLYLRTRKDTYRRLAKTWAKATGLLFAIGAVSGTALSFELGLLWPSFMEFAGSAIGPAFTLEGYAFFLEAIFLGLYLYGWDRLSPRGHWLTGVGIAFSGAMSSVLVTATNAWMQNPVGVETLVNDPANVDPWNMLFFGNSTWPLMAIHSTIATLAAVGFAVAGVYAWQMLKGKRDEIRKHGLTIAMAVGTIAAITMPLTGDLSAKVLAKNQPAKFAAMEALFETRKGAPLLVGGVPNVETGEISYGIEIPYALSFLAHGDFTSEVMGLDQVPRDQWANVPLVHYSFQIMVGAGVVMMLVGLYYAWLRWKRPDQILQSRRLHWILLLSSPLGYLALQTGWIVSEVGRQPWIVWEVMTTASAVTPSPGLMTSVIGFTTLYTLLAVVLVFLLRRLRHVQ